VIPKQLQEFNFVLIGGDGKRPIEKGWQNKIHKKDCPILKDHLSKGFNYGVQSNNSSIVINEQSYFLIVIDFDTKEFQDKVIEHFPKTFTTTSGSPKKCCHLWLASDNNKAFKIKNEKLETFADVIGAGNQVIAPGSKHKTGSIYSIINDIPISFMPYSEIEAILRPLDKSPKKVIKPKKQYTPICLSDDISEQILNSVSMEQVLFSVGINTSKNPTDCCFHSSKGGKCFSYNDETAHCFHCDGSWNKFSLIREFKKLTDKETFEWFAEECGMIEQLKGARKKYMESKKEVIEKSSDIFSRRGQIEMFWEEQPFYYDSSKIFWLWNKKLYKWELSDEIDFLNLIQQHLGIETIDRKSKGELSEGFKQVGRKHKPKPIKKSWVQFKDKIYDIKTGENSKATPEYFVTNPIPWNVGKSENTPIMDKYFEEWVGKKYKQTLYEFIAYNTTTDKFMQRVFALCGGGSNGKGSFTKLNYKFLGDENCVSSELKNLSEDKFEPAVLFRKLLCIMGEVSYNDLKNTNMLKKIGGEDKLSFQFKGKTPFTDDNTATCVCLTNSLPKTPDKSLGFYRKWLIIDFPNQFKEIKQDLIDLIPDIEFENLAMKCLRILKELYKTKKFHNEGTFEERERKYEERSNPVIRFIEKFYYEIPGKFISLREFTNSCNEHLKEIHLRVMSAIQIGKLLREEGFLVGQRKIDDVTSVVILNLLHKTIEKPLEPFKPLESPLTALVKETSRVSNGSNGSNGSQRGLNSKYDYPQG